MIVESLRPELAYYGAMFGMLVYGVLKGYMKRSIKERDGYTSKDFRRLTIHHIEAKLHAKRKGWPESQIDNPHNLIALDKDYHRRIHLTGEAEDLKESFRQQVELNTIEARKRGWFYPR